MLVVINGNTFPVKDKIKSLGFKWNPKYKSWNFKGEDAPSEGEIMEVLGTEIESGSIKLQMFAGQRGGYQSYAIKFASGDVAYINKNGRCEDAPCCGCCT